MKTNLIILLTILINFVSCNPKESNTQLDSASIFQLNSDWETQDSKQIKLTELKGKTLVMAMIYTSCKTACPRLTSEMNQIEQELGNYDPEKIRFVLVSIDPEVDTPEKMSAYLKTNKFDGKQWMFLRSNDAGTREFANVLSVKYKEISPIDFSHSNIISVFSKDGVLTYQKEGLNPDVSDIVNEINKLL